MAVWISFFPMFYWNSFHYSHFVFGFRPLFVYMNKIDGLLKLHLLHSVFSWTLNIYASIWMPKMIVNYEFIAYTNVKLFAESVCFPRRRFEYYLSNAIVFVWLKCWGKDSNLFPLENQHYSKIEHSTYMWYLDSFITLAWWFACWLLHWKFSTSVIY